ncbi:DUF4194 domain-containing protein [Nesterenkonia massiliensis]|uniref:DUF4194 domain-containing protein n=1 Tax=Nesterenkonia massiliensis TaxID=1232429 RepID=UPI000400FF52|nr:DUF4194 domain-containing protein [Nesterenkonia massiliensis]
MSTPSGHEAPHLPAEEEASSAAAWDGDTGTLRVESRRALVALVKGPFLTAERQAQNWRALMADTDAIRSRLADMYLDLVIDAERGVAFIRNAQTQDDDAPQVVRTRSMTLMDTALLLHLRRELVSAQAGQRVIIGRDEVFEQLSGYREATSTDAALFAKRIKSSWDTMVSLGILQRTPATQAEGRFEISPVLRLVFGPDEITALREVYTQMLTGRQGDVSDPDETLQAQFDGEADDVEDQS